MRLRELLWTQLLSPFANLGHKLRVHTFFLSFSLSLSLSPLSVVGQAEAESLSSIGVVRVSGTSWIYTRIKKNFKKKIVWKHDKNLWKQKKINEYKAFILSGFVFL